MQTHTLATNSDALINMITDQKKYLTIQLETSEIRNSVFSVSFRGYSS